MIDEILRTYITTEGLTADEIWKLVAKEKTAIYEIGLGVIGEDVHFNEDNCPKWLKPKEGESWEGVIGYEQGINTAKSECRLAWAKACGVNNG